MWANLAVTHYLMLLVVLLMVVGFTLACDDGSTLPGGAALPDSTDGNTSTPGETVLPENVVVEPECGQRVLVNELAILASGQNVDSLVADLGGKITVSVPQTDTYQVRFPVSSLTDLDAIAVKLEERGLQVGYVIVLEPPTGGSLQ